MSSYSGDYEQHHQENRVIEDRRDIFPYLLLYVYEIQISWYCVTKKNLYVSLT